MAEAQVQEKRGAKADALVITGETFNAYAAEKLNKTPANEDPADKAKAELAKVEKEKAERLAKEEAEKKSVGEEDEIDHPDGEKKGRLQQRFSDLTAKRKEAEEKAAKAEAKEKAAREARDRAEADAKALRDKYEPPKKDELGPKPAKAQFTSEDDFEKALMDWTADKTRMEDAAKREEERQAREAETTAKAWQERQGAFRKETTDYDDTIAKSDVKVSDQVRDAILESDVGPQILYHLAKNSDVADKLAAMTVSKALKEVGKLEAALTKEKKEETAPAKNNVAEISKAPAPISPLRNASAPVLQLSGHDDVPSAMSYESWKALRKAGKIK